MSDLELSKDEVRQALHDLVQSTGWRIFKAQAAKEWGPEGVGRAMMAAFESVEAGPDRAYQIAEVAERVKATADAVNRIMAWPSEQVRALSEPAPVGRFPGLRRTHR